jgi:hypothetical protein
VSEVDLQRAIMERLALIPGLVLWRSNCGAAKKPGRYIKFGIPGQGDLIGLLPNGRFLSIEVKMPGGPIRPEQVAFGEKVNAAGGLWFVARSVDEAVLRVHEAMP